MYHPLPYRPRPAAVGSLQLLTPVQAARILLGVAPYVLDTVQLISWLCADVVVADVGSTPDGEQQEAVCGAADAPGAPPASNAVSNEAGAAHGLRVPGSGTLDGNDVDTLLGVDAPVVRLPLPPR